MFKKLLLIALVFVGTVAANFDVHDDNTKYNVVINHEEQYSIWPVDRETPMGWKNVGKSGTKKECLDYIDKVWTDMRPLSLRKQMEADAKAKRKPN